MTELLKVTSLTKTFRGQRVLRGLSMTVCAGETWMIVGPNGCGKSTLLQLVAGILPADGGSIRIGGADLAKDRSRALENLGFAPDRGDIPRYLAVHEWLAVVSSLKRVSFPDRSMVREWGLEDLLPSRFETLSLGQQKRVTIVTALLGRPRVLALDEPTNGLDTSFLAALRDLFQEHTSRGGAILCATHDASFDAGTCRKTLQLPTIP